jgi:hypothetical protein
VIAGSLRAWWNVARITNEAERDVARQTLSRTTLETLERSAPAGKRSRFVQVDTRICSMARRSR